MALGSSEVFVASSETYAIAAYDGEGKLLRTIRLDLPRRVVDDEMVAAWRARVDRLASERPREPPPPGSPRAPRLAEAPLPDSLPALSRLLVDALGRLWARRYVFESDSMDQWDLFALDGAHLGTLRTPAALTIREIGEDYVLGVWRDELDVETVRLYPMRFP